MKVKASMVLGVVALAGVDLTSCAAPQMSLATADETALRKVEDEFRVAKVKNDVKALDALLADGYYGMNQFGAARDRAQLLALFATFKIETLEVDVHRVVVSGDSAVVAGRQRELSGSPMASMLFVRTYVRKAKRWQLLSSVQLPDAEPTTSYAFDRFPPAPPLKNPPVTK